MTSSLRAATLSDTLIWARAMASELGITRVTDTTWLDCVGIPVFASIRPGAATGSLCVNAGKGVRVEEARVGAYMEAIEFALAEPRAGGPEVELTSPRNFITQRGVDFSFVDLCPQLGHPVDPDGVLACVEAEDVSTGASLLIPAELVFFPYRENPGQQIFGTSTTGLASGNTVEEATVHGIAELIERDIQARNFFRNTSQYVHFDEQAPDIDQLRQRIDGAGLDCAVRYTPNEFSMPYFETFILERSSDYPVSISQGAGLHVIKSIAAVRSLAEAAQSRLSYIHGGRDDLIDRHQFFAERGAGVERKAEAEVRRRARDQSRSIRYSQIGDSSAATTTIQDALKALLNSLRAQGIRQVLRVVLSPADSPLAVVKLIAPKLESFQPGLRRVGPRLAALATTGDASL
ncbi:YcaO-like family protein [Streptomyces xanthochromogenes]|uniref:YcaO-like family protein n=1 Tax=Streptomyces xanthochromogenes TaxID=67384 RepID=UPI00167B1830|nr:YcaO-like family protein [Streptomyces xanthochromogenes]